MLNAGFTQWNWYEITLSRVYLEQFALLIVKNSGEVVMLFLVVMFKM